MIPIIYKVSHAYLPCVCKLELENSTCNLFQSLVYKKQVVVILQPQLYRKLIAALWRRKLYNITCASKIIPTDIIERYI